MKKIVRLTESDLVRIVKRVISEQTPSEEQSPKRFGDLQTIIAQSNEDKKTVPFCKKATIEQLCVVSNEHENTGMPIIERQKWYKLLYNSGYSPVEGEGYSYMTDRNLPGPYSTGQIWNKD